MSRLGTPGRQLRSFLFRSPVADEVDAELAFHLAMLERELMDAGMSPEAARAAAARRFGDVGAVHAEMLRTARLRERDMRRTEFLADLRQDIAHAGRQLLRARAFTAVAVLTLALGIGATTAIFSAVESVVLRAFPFAHPDRTVFVQEHWSGQDGNVSVGNFVDLHAASRSFEALAAINFSSLNLSAGAEPERVLGARVSHEFFAVFGVRPALGRTFVAGEDEPGQDQVVVLGDRLWRDRFGGDPGVVGRTLTLNERAHRVIGVMPPGFDPTLSSEQLWVPIAFTATQRAMHDEHYLDVVGLLRASVSRARAGAELEGIARDLARRFPQENADRSLRVNSLPEILVGDYRQRLLVVLGAVGLVLLIACGNVANLVLARGAARARELAIRSAIGAGRTRLVRQLLTESLVLALVAALVGLALAWALVRVIVAQAPPGIPRLEETGLDWIAVLFALALAVASSVLFGLVPALRASRQDVQATLREGAHGMGSTRDAVRGGLVIAQVAFALTLLVGAGLLIRTAEHLRHVAPGFDPSGVLAARVALPVASYAAPARVVQAYEQIVDALAREPSVAAAAVSSQAPLGPGGGSNGLLPEGRSPTPENLVDSRLRIITPDYFAALGIPLRSGRRFTGGDRAGAPRVMIVSEALARRAWPNESAIGKRVLCCEGSSDDPRAKTVVGVVADVRSNGPAVDASPEFYLPIEQAPDAAWDWVQRTMTVVARARTGDAASLAAPMRRAVRALDPALPLYGVRTMDEAMRASVADARFHTALLTTLGAIGLLLAALGIYSVIAYFVSLRSHEIGVRMALGASARDVVGLLTWQGMRPVLTGVAVGALGAMAATRLLAASLHGVSATDPLTFVGVAALLVLVGVLATLIPARRATRVDPLVALRE